MMDNKGDDINAIELDKGLFRTSLAFNLGAALIIGLLVVVYAWFW